MGDGPSTSPANSKSAWRRALVACLVVVVFIGAAAVLLPFSAGKRPVGNAPLGDLALHPEHETLSIPAASPPRVHFTDVTEAAGLRFKHVNGAEGNLWMPEMMGSGCAFLDYDNDGDQDLLLVNSSSFTKDTGEHHGVAATSRLFRNTGSGQFEDVTPGSGLDVEQYGMGVAVGDFDGDGLIDVFFANLGSDRLFRNLGDGRFLDVTAAAGIAGPSDDWSTSCAFLDYDRDGFLDLFVCNYGTWNPDLEERWLASGRGFAGKPGLRNYLPPGAMDAVDCYLYRNSGDGTFHDAGEDAGIRLRSPDAGKPRAQALGVRPLDFDNDGWLDLVVANDLPPQFLFHNQQDGTFREIGVQAGIAFDRLGQKIAGMGVDVGRVGLRDVPVLAIGNLSGFSNAMFVLHTDNANNRTFVDAADRLGVRETVPMTTFGLFFFDYDLDGRLDMMQANGHIFSSEVAEFDNVAYRQPTQLFWKAPPGSREEFVWVPPESSGTAIHQEILGRGAAYGDIDSDGDLDVVVTQNAGRAILLRNDQDLGHHWLRLNLVGKAPNTTAIGAKVRLHAGGTTQTLMVMPARSYLSQVELPLTFGLGTVEQIDFIEVTWPSGERQRIDRPSPDVRLTINES